VLTTPWASLVLLGCVVASVLWLPPRSFQSRSVVAGLVGLSSNEIRGISSSLWVVERTGDLWMVVAAPSESADEMSRVAMASPSSVAGVIVEETDIREGFFAPTRRVRTSRVIAQFADGGPVPVEQIMVLLDVIAAHAEWVPLQIPELRLTPGAGEATLRTLVLGAGLHNLGAAAACALFLVSLGWVPRTIRARREAARDAAGLCPGCGYDLRAIPADTPCPECGRSLNLLA
jgi:hypothetical protein